MSCLAAHQNNHPTKRQPPSLATCRPSVLPAGSTAGKEEAARRWRLRKKTRRKEKEEMEEEEK
ncbi:hypothetical protein E2C01_080677 [Portunus trituberculatus]|uniref:Uncharacterized protein n=1 Tax=Portunus trituberculatus TaxID=210409 RepID=A0A5B7IZ04_PORTR|nr:hypothetical protein [Portunus trituberculatus]